MLRAGRIQFVNIVGGAVYFGNLDCRYQICENPAVNWAIVFPFSFVAFLIVGLVIGGFAGYRYIRYERENEMPRLAVAILALTIQYLLMLAAFAERGHPFASMVLIFLTALALVTSMWFGLATHSLGGRRIALSGLLTFLAYTCGIAAVVIH